MAISERRGTRISEYQAEARAGDVDAMYNLAVLLEAREQWAGARLWYGRAADAGDVDAMFNLAVLFERQGDAAEAARWLRRAAQAGDHEASRSLASSYGADAREAIAGDRTVTRLDSHAPTRRGWMGLHEAAALADVTPTELQGLVAAGQVAGTVRGDRLLIRPTDLSPLLETRSRESPTAEPREILSTRQLRWLVGCVVLMAGIWPIVGSISLFPNLTRNADEVVWLSQAEVLESGALTAPAPARNPEAYQPWFASIRHGRYVYRYAPLFPAVLAASDVVTGTPRVGLGLVGAWAILSVYLLVGELVRRRGTALLAAVLVAVSPLFFLTSAMYLGYVFFIAAFCTGAWLLARGTRSGRTSDLVLAGVCFGLATFHRPYDALWLGVPWLAWFAWRSRWRAPRGISLVALGALPVIVAMLLYNWHLTGDALKPPFLLWDPRDTAGFGIRSSSLQMQQVDFTLSMGLAGVGRFWWDMLLWTVPGLPLMAGATLLVLKTAWWRLAPLAGMALALTFGWIGFWGSYYAQFPDELGPMYFLPLVVPMAALAAVGLTAAVSAVRRPASKAMVWALAVCTLAACVIEGGVHAASWQPKVRTPRQLAWQLPDPSAVSHAVGAIGATRSLILLPEAFVGFLPPLHNTPLLDGPRLYVAEQPRTNDLAIVSAHPDRAVFRLVAWLDGTVHLVRLR